MSNVYVDLSSITENKIDELVALSLENQKKEENLMETIRVHYKLWEKRLFPYCKLNGINHIDVVIEILEKGGFTIKNRNKISVYLSRAKDELGGK